MNLGQYAYPFDEALGKQLLKEAEKCIPDIRNNLDRVERFCSLAENYSKVSLNDAASYIIQETFPLAELINDNEGYDRVMGRMVEIAHSIDPAFGSSLASKIDNPMIRRKAEDKLESLELRSNPNRLAQHERKSKRAFVEACTKVFTSFCTGRLRFGPDETVSAWIEASLGKGFEAADLTTSWFIENCIVKTTGLNSPRLDDLFRRVSGLAAMILALGRALMDPAAANNFATFLPSAAPCSNIQVLGTGPSAEAEALRIVSEWLKTNAHPYVKIHDPYFNSEHIHLLMSVPEGSRVHIITSWQAQGGPIDADQVKRKFHTAWRDLADGPPPETFIHLIGIKSGEGPFHDRCVIGEHAGLAIGTSPSGFGNKTTHIHFLDADEKTKLEREMVNPLILNPPMTWNDQRVVSKVIQL